MQHSMQELMIQKNYLYRDSYRYVLTFIILLVFLALCLSSILAYLSWRKQPIINYASTTSGQVIPLHSLNQPVITNSHLLEWSTLVARQAYSLSFLNYQQQLEQVKHYFTPDAWQKYLNALNQAKVLESIKNEKIIMETVVMSSPNILYSGVLNGRFTWRVQMQVLVTYGTASEQKQQQLSILMNIARVPVLDDPEGIQVTQFAVSSFHMS